MENTTCTIRCNAEYLDEIDQQTADQLREQLEALKKSRMLNSARRLIAHFIAADDAAAQS